MAGEAIVAFVPDLMFSVQLREAAAKNLYTVALVTNHKDFTERLEQVKPALVVLDLAAVGAELEVLVQESKKSGAKVVAYGPHVQKDLLARAHQAGCDVVFPNSKFKMDTEDILTEWMGS